MAAGPLLVRARFFLDSCPVLVYAVLVDDDTRAVELFVRREDAEAFMEDVRADDEELTGTLRLEPVELDAQFEGVEPNPACDRGVKLPREEKAIVELRAAATWRPSSRTRRNASASRSASSSRRDCG